MFIPRVSCVKIVNDYGATDHWLGKSFTTFESILFMINCKVVFSSLTQFCFCFLFFNILLVIFVDLFQSASITPIEIQFVFAFHFWWCYYKHFITYRSTHRWQVQSYMELWTVICERNLLSSIEHPARSPTNKRISCAVLLRTHIETNTVQGSLPPVW